MDNKTLVLDLVEWIARRPRSYSEVMDAWRTSCPRLPIWEDAVDLAFVRREYRAGQGAIVSVTAAGRAFLALEGRGEGDPKEIRRLGIEPGAESTPLAAKTPSSQRL